MTLCPIALAVGCRKCPAFAVCPLKGVIGDQAPEAAAPETPPRRAAGKARADERPRTSKRKAAKRR